MSYGSSPKHGKTADSRQAPAKGWFSRGSFLWTLAIAGVGAFIGYGVGWIVGYSFSPGWIDRTVAMSWGDGKYGPAFYGAHVYLEPDTNGFKVMAQVHIGRGGRWTQYTHDCGVLGTVATREDAVARFGAIEWKADGLHVGSGSGAYFLPREKIESHR